jgi:hypothetical protein
MSEMKTKVNRASVEGFLDRVENAKRRADAFAILKMMKSATRTQPKMWGPSIVGFGQYHYKYDSGREGDICMIGFSPRSQALTMYIDAGFPAYEALMEKLGKYTKGHSCVYIKKLEDVDMDVLKQLVTESYRSMKKKHKS